MTKKVGFGALALLVLALLVWAFMPAPTEVETARVTLGRFERAVQEDGQTRLRERYLVSTPLTGQLARSPLKQGDAVARGAVVATLWPTVPTLLDERTRAEEVARSSALQATLAKAQANRARAGAALAQTQADLQRSQTLLQQGFISPTQHETARLNVTLRQKELESAQQEEVAARYTLDQARAALRPLDQPSPHTPPYAIRAPVQGQVLKIWQTSEGRVAAGTPLMEIGNPQQLEVVVDILTEDAPQIQPGTPAQLAHWGGPGHLAGVVRRVEPGAFTKVSALGVEEQRVNVVIDITSPPEQWATLGDGFKVDVRLLVQVVEKAVKVPVSALFPVGARSGLFVLAGGRAELREVEVAARNGQDAWVKSGLAVDTEVVVYPDSQLQDGDRVKVR